MTFPDHGTSWADLERTILDRRVLDPGVLGGTLEVYWPTNPPLAFHAAREAWAHYVHLNAFSTPYTPGFARTDEGLRAAVADLFGAPHDRHVTITAGGTEGNFLAVKAARE